MNNANVHRAGRRPINREKSFYLQLLDRYQTHSTRQLATLYSVSASTISRWVRQAKEVADE